MRFPRGMRNIRGNHGQHGIFSNAGDGKRRVQKYPRIRTQREGFHNRGENASNLSFELIERFIGGTVENDRFSRELDGEDASGRLEGVGGSWREVGGSGGSGGRGREREGERVGGKRGGWREVGGRGRGDGGDGSMEAGEGLEGRFGDAGLERVGGACGEAVAGVVATEAVVIAEAVVGVGVAKAEATIVATEATIVATEAIVVLTEAKAAIGIVVGTEATVIIITEATVVITEATVIITEATVIITEATVIITKATVIITEATVIITEATIIITEAEAALVAIVGVPKSESSIAAITVAIIPETTVIIGIPETESTVTTGIIRVAETSIIIGIPETETRTGLVPSKPAVIGSETGIVGPKSTIAIIPSKSTIAIIPSKSTIAIISSKSTIAIIPSKSETCSGLVGVIGTKSSSICAEATTGSKPPSIPSKSAIGAKTLVAGSETAIVRSKSAGIIVRSETTSIAETTSIIPSKSTIPIPSSKATTIRSKPLVSIRIRIAKVGTKATSRACTLAHVPLHINHSAQFPLAFFPLHSPPDEPEADFDGHTPS